VAKQTTLRTLLAAAGKRRMQVKHFDAKTAFLKGELKEELIIKLSRSATTETVYM
jgi:hypothetical protein